MGDRRNPSVVVIGAGMTGLLLVKELRDAGITDVILLEKANTVGGTWRENTYPGVACDVPSHAYTYSFEPNPDWSNFFPAGDEIQAYFEKVFYKYGIDTCTRFNEAVTSCVYTDGRWIVKTSQDNTYEADILIAATGMLHRPAYPDIPGLDSFAGPAFHTARWDHDVDFKGKRIGVIGTGSTACQVIPELVDMEGTSVTVFQRTAQWIVETKDKLFTDKQKERFRRQPFRVKLLRKIPLYIFETATTALTKDSWWYRLVHSLFAFNGRRYLKTVEDPELRARLTPDYKFGCKRVVMNSTFYPAIQKPNARLVTEGIDRVEPEGIVTRDGELHALDVIVMATGFDPVAYMRPMEFVGRDGVSIEQAWSRKIQAYRSMMIPQFPNFFLMLGPNSPIGNYSVIAMSEVQTAYILQLVRDWQAGTLDTIEATPEAMARWNAMLKEKMSHTVWSSGCNSWYLDADGDPLTWPDSWKAWLQAMSKPDLGDFVTS
jgi:cation diffusion facilitator CzcD-associated flavoprotein CzcO